MGLDRDLLSTVPIWIRFPSLDFKLWSKSIIRRIANMMGTPLYKDKATATGERISYARVFVEINAKRDLLNSVQIQLEGGEVMEIHITYEWIPPICQHCKSFGHLEHHCPTIEVWVLKAKEAGETDNAGVLNEAKSFVFDSEIPAGISAPVERELLKVSESQRDYA